LKRIECMPCEFEMPHLIKAVNLLQRFTAFFT
jgi:hypothetical protein